MALPSMFTVRLHQARKPALLVSTTCLAVLASACTGSTKTVVVTPTTASSEATTSSAAPSTSASTADTSSDDQSGAADKLGPGLGGVDFLRTFQKLIDDRRQPMNDLNAAGQTKDLQKAITANRQIRDAEYNFNIAVRKLTIDPRVVPDVNTMLAASNDLVAAIDKANESTTVAEFSSAYDEMTKTGQAAETAEYQVLSELNVMTKTPTAHMAPATMPYAVRGTDSNGRPFQEDPGPNGDGASYGSGGYQISISKVGLALEDVTTNALLQDAKVVGDWSLTGSDVTGYLTCRDTGNGGSSTGQEYAAGIGTTGAYYVQILDSRVNKVVNLASGQVDGFTASSSANVSERLDCIGNYLTLYYNDKPVIQVYDDRLDEGRVGIGATTPSGPAKAVLTGFDAFGKSTI